MCHIVDFQKPFDLVPHNRLIQVLYLNYNTVVYLVLDNGMLRMLWYLQSM